MSLNLKQIKQFYKGTIIIMFVCFGMAGCVLYTAKFEMVEGKAIPTTIKQVEYQIASSIIDCVHKCSDNSYCFSFYIEKTDIGWTCIFFADRIRAVELAVGNGIVGNYVHSAYGDVNEPELNQATFKFRTHNNEAVKTLVYWCAGTDYSIGVEYDKEDDSWPDLSNTCFQTLCTNPFFAASALKLSFNTTNNWEIVEPVCPYGDTKQSSVVCNLDNEWESNAIPILPLCLSSYCYRFDSNGRAIYNGTTNVAANGETCKHWKDISDVDDVHFPVDYGGKLGASNYCRDPFSSGKLMCVGQVSSNYEQCEIPRCHWPIVFL